VHRSYRCLQAFGKEEAGLGIRMPGLGSAGPATVRTVGRDAGGVEVAAVQRTRQIDGKSEPPLARAEVPEGQARGHVGMVGAKPSNHEAGRLVGEGHPQKGPSVVVETMGAAPKQMKRARGV
jgi:hypothetical protein